MSLVSFQVGVRFKAMPFQFGFLASLSVTLPLLGQSLPLGGRILSLVALLLTVAVFALPSTKKSMPSPLAATFLALATVFALFVFASASPSQFEVLASPAAWRGSAGPYYESKLIMFCISYFPPLLLAALITCCEATERLLQGWVAGLAAVAATAFVVLLSQWEFIARTDLATATNWVLSDTRTQFSTISFGLAFTFAGLSIFGLPKGKGRGLLFGVFAGVMLFGLFWLSRRGDVILFAGALALVGALSAARLGKLSWDALGSSTVAFLVAGCLVVLLANDWNWTYWGGLQEAVDTRVILAEQAVSEVVNEPVSEAVARPERMWLLGDGLGAFALSNSLLYPHNILLESLDESGPIAAAALLAMGLIVLFTPAVLLAARRGLSPLGSALYACAVVVILGALKTGDITSAGTLVALSTVALAALHGGQSGSIATSPSTRQSLQW